MSNYFKNGFQGKTYSNTTKPLTPLEFFEKRLSILFITDYYKHSHNKN